jgi:hypothetical protein
MISRRIEGDEELNVKELYAGPRARLENIRRENYTNG